MARHKWKKIGSGTYQCAACGMVKEKYFGMPWIYWDDNEGEYIKAPPCKAVELKKKG